MAMLKWKKLVAATVCGAVCAGGAFAEEVPAPDEPGLGGLSVGLSADLYTKYVWRGILLTDDPVVQPSITLSKGGFSANVWASIDSTDINEGNGAEWRTQEIDYTFSYGTTVCDSISLEAGVIFYTFSGFDSTQEVYASIGFDAPLSPTLTVYYDFDEVDGFYGTLGVGHDYEVGENLTLSASASLGYADSAYNEAYWGVTDSAFNDLTAGVSATYAFTDSFSMGASAAYVYLVDGDIRDVAKDNGSGGEWILGLNATYSF